MTELKAKLETVPTSPGVYVFRDGRGRVIYVGKAKSLRDRVRSYFQAPVEGDAKGEALREEIADLEVTVCGNEIDALILEATLIKKYRPRYNVVLRDDKSYPYIAVSVSEKFPRATLTRGKRSRGVKYYGPYVNARAARGTLRFLQKVFPLRHCAGPEPGRKGGSPCLYYQLKMCVGPCTGEVTAEQYQRIVKSFCDFLEGRPHTVMKDLDRRMRDASRNMEYEEAARIRNQIESADRVLSHDRALSSSFSDYDLVGVHMDNMQASFAVAQNRAGMHLGNLCFFTDLTDPWSLDELVTEFVKRYYDQAGSIPAEVLVPACPDDPALCEWLSGERGARVTIKVPMRGKKRRELALANANARLGLEGAKMNRARDKARVDAAIADLARYLELSSYPLRIECYDISTMGGTASVGSLVAFQDGHPERRSYKKFGIKFTPGVDDVGMMKEVLYRRFKRYIRESEEAERAGGSAPRSGFARKPDLILLDGGKGQLGAGTEVLKVLGIVGVEVAALAKRLEEVYRPGRPEPIVLPRDSEGLFLLQRIRDEAHRVAVSYHRSIMEKRTAGSWLDGVSGVGPSRKRALIRHFGSPRRLAEATLEEIESVPGVPGQVAGAVFEASRRIKEIDAREIA
jgi:excinuclease ABC subunit C